MSFSVRNSLVLVDTGADAAAARSITLDAQLYAEVVSGLVRLDKGRQVLVVSFQNDPHQLANELVARGFAMADVRYIDLREEFPLQQMARSTCGSSDPAPLTCGKDWTMFNWRRLKRPRSGRLVRPAPSGAADRLSS